MQKKECGSKSGKTVLLGLRGSRCGEPGFQKTCAKKGGRIGKNKNEEDEGKSGFNEQRKKREELPEGGRKLCLVRREKGEFSGGKHFQGRLKKWSKKKKPFVTKSGGGGKRATRRWKRVDAREKGEEGSQYGEGISGRGSIIGVRKNPNS